MKKINLFLVVKVKEKIMSIRRYYSLMIIKFVILIVKYIVS